MWTQEIVPRLPLLFDDVKLVVKPSLLHGDLWSGNIGSAQNGRPSIYDPAVYWGHHEAEWGKLLHKNGCSFRFCCGVGVGVSSFFCSLIFLFFYLSYFCTIYYTITSGMSWCASLGPTFWDGYRSLILEDPGFRDWKPLYDAYHQLNHYNLFGGGYLQTTNRCLAISTSEENTRY